MKWTVKYKDDNVRIIKKFLLIPWRLGNEWRWLETAYIWEKYYKYCWLDKEWSTYQDYMSYKLEQAMKDYHISPEAVADFQAVYTTHSDLTLVEEEELLLTN